MNRIDSRGRLDDRDDDEVALHPPSRGGAKKKERRRIGALALPLPSPAAQAESLDDGSLQIVDVLTSVGLGRFLVDTSALIEQGDLDAPVWFGTTLRDGTSVRFDLGRGPDARQRIAAQMSTMGLTILGGRADPASFSMVLECGCGVRVDRRDDDGCGVVVGARGPEAQTPGAAS